VVVQIGIEMEITEEDTDV